MATSSSLSINSVLENPTSPPSPVQAGVAINCNRWIRAGDGDTCWGISNRSDRGVEKFYADNPVLGPKGENCSLQLWKGYWYCIGTGAATSTGKPLTVAQSLPTPAAVEAVQKGPASASVVTTNTTTTIAVASANTSPVASAPPASSPLTTSPTTASPATTSPAVLATSATIISSSAAVPPPPPPPPSSPEAAAAAAAGGGGIATPEGVTYLGCASEAPGRALNQLATAGADMTIEKCLAFCAGARLPLAGLEYGHECFCGTSLAPPSALLGADAKTTCRMPCAGNKSQVCGGPSLLSVFRNDSMLLLAEQQQKQKVGAGGGVSSPLGGFEYLGCYDEGKGRVLPEAMKGDDALTVEKCVGFCEGKGFGLAGVEYGRECWCAKALKPGAARLDEGRCGMRCKGDGSQLCGGSGAIGVYGKKGGGGGGGGGGGDGKTKKRGEEHGDNNKPPTVVKTVRLVRRGRWGVRRGHA